MTEILFSKCDGGKKGESCRKTMEIACENFFGCGVKKIEDACNDRREKLMREWGGRNPEDPIEYDLQVSFKRGIEEITPPYDLYEPETIEVYILEGEKSQQNEGLAAMDIRPLNEELTRWKLCVYLDVMDYANFTTRHGERNQVFCRLNQANRCFLSILERQKRLSKRKTWFLIFDVG